MSALAEALAGSPELFPLRLSPDGQAQLLRLTEDDYRAASFLDERLATAALAGGVAGAVDLAAAAARLEAASDFIFHIGHVGSTLLARLLGGSARIFALREPAILRQAARGEAAAERLDGLVRLLSRVWRPDQRALVKATSFVSEIGPALIDASPDARAILMIVRAETFLAGILGGDSTRAELPVATPPRIERLARRLGRPPPRPASPGEMAAAVFAAEIASLQAIAEARPERVVWIDFDDFLLDPRRGLGLCLTHLHGEAPPRELSRLLASPDMGRYAKAPEHPFGPGQRGAILRQSAQDNAAEIAAGLRWLGALSQSLPALQRRTERPGVA